MSPLCSFSFLFALLCTMLALVSAAPLQTEHSPEEAENAEIQALQKRLSNDALIRLMMNKNRMAAFRSGLKRSEKRAEMVERRAVDDDFSNCFLSPVQCMLRRR